MSKSEDPQPQEGTAEADADAAVSGDEPLLSMPQAADADDMEPPDIVPDLDDADEASLAIRELREELDALNDRHLRLAAEFDNYRRRSQTQLMESGVRSQASLVSTLLEALDDFGRMTSIDPELATVESVLEGVVLVESKLFQLLEEAGLEELDPVGSTFDPNVMEAMLKIPADSVEDDDTVAEVFQKGFRFRGYMVRPARVSVRKLE
jgi:molecular chaperone GrpE